MDREEFLTNWGRQGKPIGVTHYHGYVLLKDSKDSRYVWGGGVWQETFKGKNDIPVPLEWQLEMYMELSDEF